MLFAPEEQHVYSQGSLDIGLLREERELESAWTLHYYGAHVAREAKGYKHAALPEQKTGEQRMLLPFRTLLHNEPQPTR